MSVPPNSSYFQVFPFFTGTDNQQINAIYLIPPNFSYGVATTFTISYLYQTGADLPPSYGNDDFIFALSQQGSGDPNQNNVVATITLTGLNMWKAASSARQALMDNFVGFLQYIETNFELAGVLIPGATFIISQYVADRIPAPPLETLFYRYSLSSGTSPGTKPYIDIQPGMHLRLETEASQYLTPSSQLNGYVSNGPLDLVINSVPGTPQRTVAFDPFLSTIRSPAINGGSGGVPFVASGVVDLEPVSAARSHVRLFYPASMPAGSLPGDLSMVDNVTLLGSPTLAALNQATTQFPTPITSGSPPNVYTIIRGRAIAVPQIPIWITFTGGPARILEYVPIGTTITQIIERYTPIPLAIPQSTVSVMRTYRSSGSSSQTAFSWFATGLYAYTPSMFDVPLIAGDGVTISV